MSKQYGSGWLGANEILTTSANQEIVPPSPPEWMNVKFSFYKFQFRNLQSCTIKINDGEPIYLEEEQGFLSDYMDQKIYSFVIVEPNIQYQWIGAY